MTAETVDEFAVCIVGQDNVIDTIYVRNRLQEVHIAQTIDRAFDTHIGLLLLGANKFRIGSSDVPIRIKFQQYVVRPAISIGYYPTFQRHRGISDERGAVVYGGSGVCSQQLASRAIVLEQAPILANPY